TSASGCWPSAKANASLSSVSASGANSHSHSHSHYFRLTRATRLPLNGPSQISSPTIMAPAVPPTSGVPGSSTSVSIANVLGSTLTTLESTLQTGAVMQPRIAFASAAWPAMMSDPPGP